MDSPPNPASIRSNQSVNPQDSTNQTLAPADLRENSDVQTVSIPSLGLRAGATETGTTIAETRRSITAPELTADEERVGQAAVPHNAETSPEKSFSRSDQPNCHGTKNLLSNEVIPQVVPENFVFPPEKRPGTKSMTSVCKTIPIIDLKGGTNHELQSNNRHEVVEQILNAGKEFGFFQVINHGIPKHVIEDMMGVAKEFFQMSAEDKAPYYSEDATKNFRIHRGGRNSEKISCWRECLKMVFRPVEDFQHLLPEKLIKFRKPMEDFSMEVISLAMQLLKLIAEGLGLKEDYFEGDISGGNVTMNVNHYAPCPDPSLTLGLWGHCDPNLITVLFQGDVSGLQVFHEECWMDVEPIDNAFVVNFGHQIEVITNGMLRSVEHRAVTNSTSARTTIATFINPKLDCLIVPARSIVDSTRPLYRSFLYQEFNDVFGRSYGDRRVIAEEFMKK